MVFIEINHWGVVLKTKGAFDLQLCGYEWFKVPLPIRALCSDIISAIFSLSFKTRNPPNRGNSLNNIPTENIILNNGESYSVAITPYPSSTNSANATGLIGALIESDKPIAVNSGSFTGSNSNYNEGGGQDVGIDQVAPANIIGDEYIFVRGLGPDEVERPLIVAHDDNTEIFVTTAKKSTSKSELQKYLFSGSLFSVKSNIKGQTQKKFILSNAKKRLILRENSNQTS